MESQAVFQAKNSSQIVLSNFLPGPSSGLRHHPLRKCLSSASFVLSFSLHFLQKNPPKSEYVEKVDTLVRLTSSDIRLSRSLSSSEFASSACAK